MKKLSLIFKTAAVFLPLVMGFAGGGFSLAQEMNTGSSTPEFSGGTQQMDGAESANTFTAAGDPDVPDNVLLTWGTWASAAAFRMYVYDADVDEVYISKLCYGSDVGYADIPASNTDWFNISTAGNWEVVLEQGGTGCSFDDLNGLTRTEAEAVVSYTEDSCYNPYPPTQSSNLCYLHFTTTSSATPTPTPEPSATTVSNMIEITSTTSGLDAIHRDLRDLVNYLLFLYALSIIIFLTLAGWFLAKKYL